MSFPAFYWYPAGTSSGATLETTSLGEDLTSLTHWPVRPRADARAQSGRLSATQTGAARQAVRPTLERFQGRALARALESLSAHLEAAGAVGFANDPAKAWAGYSLYDLPRGKAVIETGGNAWYVAGAALAAGDEVVIEGLSSGQREWAALESVSGDQLTLSSGVVYTYESEVVLVRHRHFWPVLMLPAEEMRRGAGILTTVREIHYTLDVVLHTDPAVLAVFGEMGVSQDDWLGSSEALGYLTLDMARGAAARFTPITAPLYERVAPPT